VNVSLSHFIDFCLANGRERVRLVREIRHGKDSRFDLYAPLRRALVDYHVEGPTKAPLSAFAESRADFHERRHFGPAVNGYLRFLKRQGEMQWFEPAMRDYPLGPAVVRVDPELGLMIEGRPHMLKLYLRQSAPERLRTELLTTLMQMSMQTVWPGTTFAVLDARRGRFHPYKMATVATTKDHIALLHAEAAAFGSLWTNV
jgi:hypothetical protein